jgi:hypothetical protein
MNCNPTLTSEEFKTIHNALCDLDSITRKLEGVLNEELYARLLKSASEIRTGLSGAYEQDNKADDAAHNHYRDVQEQLGLNDSIWSIYEVSNLADCHKFGNVDRVVYRDHWGDKPVSCSVNGTSWAALYVAANACIRDSGDSHHVFIEDFNVCEEDPGTLVLVTGS